MEEGKGTPAIAPAQGAAISNRLFELRDDVMHIQVGETQRGLAHAPLPIKLMISCGNAVLLLLCLWDAGGANF